MFDIGWTELLLIGVVALIVVGPKDLPGMFRTLGRFTARMRSMAREFQRAMEQAADESGVKDVAADLRTATSARRLGLDTIQDSARRFQKSFKEETSIGASSKADGKPAGKTPDGSSDKGGAEAEKTKPSGPTETAEQPEKTGNSGSGGENAVAADAGPALAETVQPQAQAAEPAEGSEDARK